MMTWPGSDKAAWSKYTLEFMTARPTMTKAEPSREQQIESPDQHLVADRYRLLGRIGCGRLGDIYEADDDQYRDLAVERRVAIQLLPDRVTLNRGLFNKLKLGYTVLRAAPHPNVVPFIDFDHDGRVGYLATELLDGASMRALLDSVTTLPLDEVVPVVRAVGDALQFLHAKSIVHGRLTAESVFVTEGLEVRLLDIVPLNSAKSVPGSVASGDPFSRHDVAGDIYALACLTYEMLAGKHPFNFHAVAEARRAGLKPARIDSLPEKQWEALRQALAFDVEQRTPAVADFLREFGVEGTERLRPSGDAGASYESSNVQSVREVPATTRPVTPPGYSPAATPTPPATPVARRENALDTAGIKVRRARWVRSAILLMVLAGLAAWSFYGQPRDVVVALIDVVDSYVGNSALPVDEGGIARTAPGIVEPTDSPADIATHDEDAIDAREASPATSMTGDDAAPEHTATDRIDTAPLPPVEEPAVVADTVAQQSSNETAISESANASNDAGLTQGEPPFKLVHSVVYVSESSGAAQIANPLPENTAGQVFWWTADNTAVGESDYIRTQEPQRGFAAGDGAETLHIPLINDSIAEPRETFYVYLGRQNPQLGRLETIARVSVEISDDDL